MCRPTPHASLPAAPMKHFELRGGDQMPAFGLGTWNSEPGEVGRAIRTALELGYRHVDCAAIYGNEKEIGEAFEAAFADGIVERDDLWITSKLWCNHHRAEDVVPALERTVADLRCEYLDLYLVHWPVATKPDVQSPTSGDDFLTLDEVPLTETWRGMCAGLERGLTRHIGVSNYSSKKLRAHADLEHPPEVNQVELHPYLQQDALRSVADDMDVVLTAYSPLGSKARPQSLKSEDEPVLLEDEMIAEIAREHDATPAQVLIAWAIQRGTVVIPKSTNPKRIEENLKGASLELSASAMERIAKLDKHRRYVDGAFWSRGGGPYTVEALWDGDA